MGLFNCSIIYISDPGGRDPGVKKCQILTEHTFVEGQVYLANKYEDNPLKMKKNSIAILVKVEGRI